MCSWLQRFNGLMIPLSLKDGTVLVAAIVASTRVMMMMTPFKYDCKVLALAAQPGPQLPTRRGD